MTFLITRIGPVVLKGSTAAGLKSASRSSDSGAAPSGTVKTSEWLVFHNSICKLFLSSGVSSCRRLTDAPDRVAGEGDRRKVLIAGSLAAVKVLVSMRLFDC